MIAWPLVTLGDHVNIQTGFPFKSASFLDDPKTGVRLLRGDNIGQGRLRWDGAKHWPAHSASEYREFQVNAGDVVLAMDRPWIEAGLKFARVEQVDLPCLLVQRVALISGRPSLLTTYLNYLIGSPDFVGHVKSIITGVNVPHISGKDIRRFEFRLPPLPIQHRIASILGAYDDLIEINRRRIAILEEMARRLFDEWFVKFRFPGHEGHEMVETEHGLLPEGWDVHNVEEVVRRLPVGRKYDQKTVSATGTVPVLDQGRSGIIGYHDDQAGVAASEAAPVIVFANHTCYQRLVHFAFSAIQNVLPFVPSVGLPRNIYWLHYATNGLVTLNDYKGHWPEFAAKKLLVPSAALAGRFGAFAAPVSHSVLKIQRTNENLRQQRDLLLPRLISGELSVAAADIQLETAA